MQILKFVNVAVTSSLSVRPPLLSFSSEFMSFSPIFTSNNSGDSYIRSGQIQKEEYKVNKRTAILG